VGTSPKAVLAVMRVAVDGLDGERTADTVRVILAWDSGELAEVQVARVGGLLSVVLAGDLGPLRTTRRGVQAVVLAPTKGK
jgi:hypothetical protein